jgi:carbon starvation protein
LQELFSWKGRGAAALATAVTLLPPFFFIGTARPAAPGVRPAYMDFWTLFGTSNQLLAALTLLAVTVWLHRERRRIWYTAVPMVFVMVITLWALGIQVVHSFRMVTTQGVHLDAASMNGVVGLILILLALAVIFEAAKALLAPAPTERRASGAATS